MNNKGFSMIELLAVIVVLGIISTIGIVSVLNMTDKSKDEYYKIQNENFVMAAESFVNENRSFLPKEIGGVSKIYLDKLIQMKYIKENIYDQNKKPCNPARSYVSVFKVSETEYKYVGYLNCPSCKTEDNYCEHDSNERPKAIVKLDSVKDEKGKDQIRKATCSITMKGNESGNKKIFSYSYKIFTDEVLKYSSGTIRTSKTSLSFNLNDLVSKYTPGKVRVILNVTNEDGYTKTVSDSYSYGDTTKPHCGRTTNEGTTKFTDEGVKICNDDQWVRSRDMFIMCDDVHGVGCKMHEFSEHFTRESKPYGLDSMKIYDTSDNDYDCPVYTCIDLTPPEMTIEMYKNDKDGKPTGNPIRKFNVNKVEADQDLGWFNSSYPKGVSFKINVKDNILLKSYTAQYNDAGLYMSKAEKDKFKNNSKGNVDNYYKLSYDTTSDLTAEGRRYIKFVAKDAAGNESSITLKLEIDRTAPTLKIDVGRCNDIKQDGNDDATCKAYTNLIDTGSMTAKEGDPTKTINKKTWVSKGLKISYSTSDHNSLTDVWSWDKQYSMTTAGDATKANSFGSSKVNSNNEDVKLDGTVSLTGTGQRQGIFTATDPAGNNVKVTINVYIANKCTITFDQNDGTFGANSSAAARTWVVDYNNYAGSSDNGLPNVVGSSSYFVGSKLYNSVISTKHWNTNKSFGSGTTYDESRIGDNRYKAQNICSGMTDGKHKSITLYANWKKNTCTVTYSPNGGSFNTTSSTTDEREYDEYFGSIQYGLPDAEGGTYDAKRDYYHIDSAEAWVNSDTSATKILSESNRYIATSVCSGLTTGSRSVTLGVNWKKNSCTIDFYPGNSNAVTAAGGNARFTKNASKTHFVKYYGDVITIPNNRQDDDYDEKSYYKPRRDGYVVAALAEWYVYDDGEKKYLFQNTDIDVEDSQICPNLRTKDNTNVKIYVAWLSQKPHITIYTWDWIENHCEGDNPYRRYYFAPYKCYCSYNVNSSQLISAQAFYSRHKTSSLCPKGLLWNDLNGSGRERMNDPRAACFPPKASVYYRNTQKGLDACKGTKDEDGNRLYAINQYVRLVCVNGDVYNHNGIEDDNDAGVSDDGSGYKYFHGAYWYWNTGENTKIGFRKAHLEKILPQSEELRLNHFEDIIDMDDASKPGEHERAVTLTYGGSNNSIQNQCDTYCNDLYGEERFGDEDYVYVDDDD